MSSINFKIAQYKYISLLRDRGESGELTYPDKNRSTYTDKCWILRDHNGNQLANVTDAGFVRMSGEKRFGYKNKY